jgi:hypothetical protein
MNKRLVKNLASCDQLLAGLRDRNPQAETEAREAIHRIAEQGSCGVLAMVLELISEAAIIESRIYG